VKSVYSVYDVKAEAYSPLFMQAHDAAAVRAFGELLSDRQSLAAKYPEDYELHVVGEFEECPATLSESVLSGGVPRVVITGAQWVQAQAGPPSLVKEA